MDKFDSELTTLAREFNVSLRDNARTPPGFSRKDSEPTNQTIHHNVYLDDSFESELESDLSVSHVSSITSLSLEEEEFIELPPSPVAEVCSAPVTPRPNTPLPLQFSIVTAAYPDLFLTEQPSITPLPISNTTTSNQNVAITSLESLAMYQHSIGSTDSQFDHIALNSSDLNCKIDDLLTCLSPCLSQLGPLHPVTVYLACSVVKHILANMNQQTVNNTNEAAQQVGLYRQALTILQPCLAPPCLDGRLCRNKHKDGVLALFTQTRNTVYESIQSLYTEQVRCVGEYNTLQHVKQQISEVDHQIYSELNCDTSPTITHTAEYITYPVPPTLPSFLDIQGYVCVCGLQVDASWLPVNIKGQLYCTSIFEFTARLQSYHRELRQHALKLAGVQQDLYTTLSVIKGARDQNADISVQCHKTNKLTSWVSYTPLNIPLPPGYLDSSYLPITITPMISMFARFSSISVLYTATLKPMISLLHAKTLESIPEYLKHNTLRLEKKTVNVYKPPIRPVLPQYVTKHSDNALLALETQDQVSTTLATTYNLLLQWTSALQKKVESMDSPDLVTIVYNDSIHTSILTHSLYAYFYSIQQHSVIEGNISSTLLSNTLPLSLRYTNTMITHAHIERLQQLQAHSQIHKGNTEYREFLHNLQTNAQEEAQDVYSILHKPQSTESSSSSSVHREGCQGLIELVTCRANKCAILGDLRRHSDACQVSTTFPPVLSTAGICSHHFFVLVASLKCNLAAQHEWDGQGEQAITLYKQAKQLLIDHTQDKCICPGGYCQEQGLKLTIQHTITSALQSLAKIHIVPPNSRLTRPKSAVPPVQTTRTQRANADTVRATNTKRPGSAVPKTIQ